MQPWRCSCDNLSYLARLADDQGEDDLAGQRRCQAGPSREQQVHCGGAQPEAFSGSTTANMPPAAGAAAAAHGVGAAAGGGTASSPAAHCSMAGGLLHSQASSLGSALHAAGLLCRPAGTAAGLTAPGITTDSLPVAGATSWASRSCCTPSWAPCASGTPDATATRTTHHICDSR